MWLCIAEFLCQGPASVRGRRRKSETELMGIFAPGYAMHQYHKWLVTQAATEGLTCQQTDARAGRHGRSHRAGSRRRKSNDPTRIQTPIPSC